MKPLFLLAAVAISGCATPGARPQDMSAAEHDAAADKHDQLSGEHADQYPPWSTRPGPRCPTLRGKFDSAYDFCWSSVVNPMAHHRDEADAHHQHALDHRAASAALREAEAKACGGIAEGDRDMSPFEHPEDILSVTPLPQSGNTPEAGGAAIVLRSVPGMTRESLQYAIDCHLARNAALGHSVPEMPNCPLVPKGVAATVRVAKESFVVEVRGSDAATAREILGRAQRAAAASPASQRGAGR